MPLTGWYLSEPSRHLTITSSSGATKKTTDLLICWRFWRSSGIRTRCFCNSQQVVVVVVVVEYLYSASRSASNALTLAVRVATQNASAPCMLTISSYLFARWHLFRHAGYYTYQQQVDLWPFDLESGVRVTRDVGCLCANFSLHRRSVLQLGPIYATDVRQKHRLMPRPMGAEA